jgi:MFS family permease
VTARWRVNFVALLALAAVFAFGDHFESAASTLFVFDETASNLALGLFELAFWLPLVMTRLLSTPLLDKGVSFKTVIGSLSFVECVLVGLAGALYLNHRLTVGNVFALQILKGAAAGAIYPLMVAIVPLLAPASRLATVNSALQAVDGALMLLGPSTAAVLVKAYRPGVVFLLDGATFLPILVSLLAFRFLHTTRAGPEAPPGRYLAGMRSALHYFRRDRQLVGMSLAVGMLFTAERAVSRQLLPFAIEQGSDVVGMGILQSSAAVGYLVGGLLGLVVLERRWRFAIGGIMVSSGLFLASLSMIQGLTVSAVALGFYSLALPLCFAQQNTLFQQRIPESVRGGVTALGTSLTFAVGPLGAVVGGAIAERWGLRAMFASVGLSLAVCFAFLMSRGAIWTTDIEAELPRPASST